MARASISGPESWAAKYDAMANGKFGSKSGFSPMEYVLPALGQTSEPTITAIEKWQRNIFYGFTSRELDQLDCLPTRELKSANLQNAILPILRRENWEKAPAQPDLTRDHLYPLQNGRGMWSADNDVVWSVMEPIVRLASRILTSVHVTPWFDALLNGERRPIPDHRLRPADKNETNLQSFHPKGFSKEPFLARQRDYIFETLRSTFGIQYGFMIPTESPEGPEKDAEDSHHSLGLMVTNHDYMAYGPNNINKRRKVFIFINLSQLELLMRDGLNSAERMTIEWSIATTIAHETMHAVAALFTVLADKPEVGEPYFEDQAVAEVGFGFESAINSGIPEPYLFDLWVPNPPLGYFLRRPWPSYEDVDFGDSMTPTLTAPGPLTYSEYFPIPISFFQDIQQEDFWSIGVRQFGNSIFHYRTLNEGARKDYNVTDEAEGKFKKSKAARFKERTDPKNDSRLNWKFRFGLKGLKAAMNLTPDERTAMLFGQRLLLSSKMQEDFWNDVEEQEASIRSITDTINPATLADNSPDHIRQTFLSIFTFTQQAIHNHERMVAETISQENADGIAYPNRRAKLLAWNKGTRSFIRQLAQADAGRNLNLRAEELRLEFCRMALWNPNDATTKSGSDWLEILILQNARQALNSGNVYDCRNTCIRLLREDWRTEFADCAARAILFTLEKNISEGWPVRVAELQEIAHILESLKAGAPEYWRDEVLALQTEVAGLIASTVAAPVSLRFPQ